MSNILLVKMFAFLAAVGVVLGCGGAGSVLTDNRPIVRTVNVISGTTVNAVIDDSNGPVTVLDNAPFASAAVNRVNAGSRQVTFRDGAGAFLIAQTFDLADNESSTIVGSGSAGSYSVTRLHENYTPSAGNAAVRILQVAGIPAPMVNIYTGTAGSSITNATLIHDNLQTGTSVPYRDIPAGTTKFFVTESANTNLLVSDDLDFVAGKHYTLIVATNGPIQLVTVTED